MARHLKRDTELANRAGVRKKLLETFADVTKGFEDQRARADEHMDNWDLFNCKLTDRQFYNGNSKIFMPYVHDAVNARKTRFVNQIFPQSGRYVDVTTTDGEIPHAVMSLLEGYVRNTKLRTEVMPALMINGDLEGQYSLYVSWVETKRRITRRKTVADQKMKGLPDDALMDLGSHEEIEDEEVETGAPHVEVLHDADLLILPVTVNSIDEAIDAGGSVTVLRRWSKARIRKAINDGEILKDEGEALIKAMQKAAKEGMNRDTGKDMADAAGIKGAGKEAVVFETWTVMKVEGDHYLTRAYYAGEQRILGCKRSPYWCERPPVITAPVEKIAGVVKGRPPVNNGVADLQVLANDTVNEAADTGHFSALPIVMTDPEKNPRVSSMVLGLAAVWETSPKDTQFAQFPDMWRSLAERAEQIKGQIFQTLGVNPSMVPQSTGGKQKRNQAEIANEQQVDILTTADAVTILEEGVLTPLLTWFAELDHQYRDEATTVRVFGQMGLQAAMEDVEPLQLNERWSFKWWGVEAARDAARMQQQIAGVNVIKGVPPNMYAGYELDLAPMLVQMAENLFGPRLAPLIFKKKTPITIPPELENEMLEHGHMVDVHEADDDIAHMQSHVQALTATGDLHGTIRDHLAKHQQQMQKKADAAMQQQMAQGGLPGTPGGAGPGAAGAPKPGGQPGTPRGVKGPPGMIHADQMPAAGAVGMPRQ
jgi:hypothetical protein